MIVEFTLGFRETKKIANSISQELYQLRKRFMNARLSMKRMKSSIIMYPK